MASYLIMMYHQLHPMGHFNIKMLFNQYNIGILIMKDNVSTYLYNRNSDT